MRNIPYFTAYRYFFSYNFSISVATRGNYTYRSRSAAQSSGEHIKTCRYETRLIVFSLYLFSF